MVDGYRPESLRQALEMRKEHHAVPFAGGTDLMVRYRSPAGVLPQFPWPVLYLNHLKEIQGIAHKDGMLVIGAGTTLTEIEEDGAVPALLRKAVSQMAAPALRNLGTLAGNVCNASPAGDALCALYSLDARVELTSVEGSRILSLPEFIQGPGRSALCDDEILTSILIPVKDFSTLFYRKVGTRKANALSKLSVCALALIKDGRINDVRIAFGAVGPTVLRSQESEKLLFGASSEELEALHDEVLSAFDAMITPIDDQRSTAVYRKHVAMNLLRQFLDQIAKELRA
jgi:CO/xanthine dehydrogenase FAD-binding subunit